jgi:hypothetical protein
MKALLFGIQESESRRMSMLAELQYCFDQPEDRRWFFDLRAVGSLKDDQITRKPGQDRRSLLQVIQHIILGERGARGQGEAAIGRKLPRDDRQY